MKLLFLTLMVLVVIQAQASKFEKEWILVKFQPGKAPANSGRSKGHPDLKRMPVLPNESVAEAIVRYSESQDVVYAEPDFVVSLDVTPTDTYFSSQWGMPKINAPAAWDKFTGSVSTKICVIDTGVDYNHPDLAGNVAVGYNAITGINDGKDDHSHGTHCAGIIGAKGNNGGGVAGVNWKIQIIPCKFMSSSGSGNLGDAVECIYWCRDQGASILSNSWGSAGYSQSVYDAINDVGTHNDVLFISSAGNSGNDNSVTPNFPAAFASSLSNMISVAASDSSDNLASYSNYGTASTQLAAPGSSIYSTILAGSYGYKSGTSMAAPHVSGAAAFLKAADPTLTSAQIKAALVNNVDVLNSLSGYVSSGGRLNLNKALAAAVPGLTAPVPPSSPAPTSPSPSPSPLPSPSPSPTPTRNGKRPKLARRLKA